MNTNNAEQIFYNHFGDTQTFTPPATYGVSGRYAWEIQAGGLGWPNVFLVTVLDIFADPIKGVWMGNMVAAFDSLDEAKEYTRTLGGQNN